MAGKKGMKHKVKRVAKAKKPKHTKLVQSSSSKVGKSLSLGGNHPLPRIFTTTMVYSQTLNYTTGTLGIMGTSNVFRLNNIYDPDYTGGGHQPYGFDQISPLYGRYRVNWVKIANIWTTSGGSAEIMTGSSLQSGTGGSFLVGASVDYVTEFPSIKTGILSASGVNRVFVESYDVPIYKILGITKQAYENDDDYIAVGYTAIQPPAALSAYLFISIGSPSGVGAQAATCQTIINYNVTFYSTVTQAQS